MRPDRNLKTLTSNPVRSEYPEGNLRLVIPASEWSVRCGLSSIKSGIEGLGLSEDELGTVELVIAEVLNNIVEHAYRDTENGMIELELTSGADGLNCTIVDDGHPMPNEELPNGHPTDLSGDIDSLPEGGFGWFLIRQLTNELSYRRHNSRNIFTCNLAIGLLQQAM